MRRRAPIRARPRRGSRRPLPDGRSTPPDGDYFGWVAGRADLEGDGTLDLAAGAPGTERGSVYVFDAAGVLDGTGVEAMTRLDGEETDQGVGQYVHAIGDTDGDGADELLVGDEDGAMYIASTPGIGVLALADVSTALDLGISSYPPRPVPLGDWDGDGHTDLLVSLASDRFAIFFGPIDAGATADDAGVNYSDLACGGAVTPIGDADGDGLGDLILDGGEINVVAGARSGTHDCHTRIRWLEPPAGDVPLQLAAAGDLDGDGEGDLAVVCEQCATEGGEEWDGVAWFLTSSALGAP